MVGITHCSHPRKLPWWVYITVLTLGGYPGGYIHHPLLWEATMVGIYTILSSLGGYPGGYY